MQRIIISITILLSVLTGLNGCTFFPGVHKIDIQQGNHITQEMIDKLKSARSLFDEFDLSIHEVHHTKKVDAPSGTALSWDEWVGGSSSINGVLYVRDYY